MSLCSISLFLPHFLLSMEENKYLNFLSFCLSNTICGLVIVSWLARIILRTNGLRALAWSRETKKKNNTEYENRMSLLDLPDLTLDCIFEKLSPSELCAMTCVCSELRDKCVSDHLWEKHLEKKWGRLMGDAAIKEWKSHVATLMLCLGNSNRSSSRIRSNTQWSSRFVANLKPFSWLSRNHGCGKRGSSSLVAIDSVMYWYSNLENGKFWFPAQVYNRENGHVGFVLSCYDAKIRYDCKTDTFQARYSAHGRRAAEEKVTWQRLRPSLIDTMSRDLHVSDCLQGLRPGDHFEIQWRRTKEFPYGWWYGIVGHLQNCDGEENCSCHSDENVVMEFRQFRPESPWRATVINRKNHRETGNENDGFYGGVKKLGTEEEISTWKRLWPAQVLE